MYEAAKTKRADAWAHIEDLELARSGDEFRRRFNAAATAIRSVPYAISTDGKRFFRAHDRSRVRPFSDWLESKRVEVRDDELLGWVVKLRNADIHEGTTVLQFSTEIARLEVGSDDPDRPPGASVVIDPHGPYWLVNAGTKRERRIPIERDGFATFARLSAPPQSHLGSPVTASDPVSVLKVASEYFAEMCDQACTQFPMGL